MARGWCPGAAQGSVAAMLDALPPSPPRTIGSARLGLGLRDDRTVLRAFRQQGSLKLLFPRGPGFEAVALNTAGGLTSGDRIAMDVITDAGTTATLTTQAAERAYRADGPPARVRTSVTAGAGASLAWLPQETILYDRAALDRRLEVDLHPSASFVGIETLVFGRAAMGERCRALALRDRWRVRRGGRLIFADDTRIMGDADAILSRAAPGAGATALIVHAAPHVALPDLPPGAAGAIPRDGLAVIRATAPDSFALRARTLPIILALTGRPPPKVWRL
ncbi:MAG: urease accessory protein UreD [Paracoccaceae bacterium]